MNIDKLCLFFRYTSISFHALMYETVAMLLKMNEKYSRQSLFFLGEIKPPECKCFLSFQLHAENVHAEAYSQILNDLDPFRNPNEFFLRCENRSWYYDILKSADDLIGGIGYETNGSLRSDRDIDSIFPEILANYVIERFLFPFACLYVLHRISVFFETTSSQCWNKINVDCIAFVRFACLLHHLSNNKLSSAYVRFRLKRATASIKEYVENELFHHHAWNEMRNSKQASLRSFPDACLRDVSTCLDRYSEVLASLLNSYGEGAELSEMRGSDSERFHTGILYGMEELNNPPFVDFRPRFVIEEANEFVLDADF